MEMIVRTTNIAIDKHSLFDYINHRLNEEFFAEWEYYNGLTGHCAKFYIEGDEDYIVEFIEDEFEFIEDVKFEYGG